MNELMAKLNFKYWLYWKWYMG